MQWNKSQNISLQGAKNHNFAVLTILPFLKDFTMRHYHIIPNRHLK